MKNTEEHWQFAQSVAQMDTEAIEIGLSFLLKLETNGEKDLALSNVPRMDRIGIYAAALRRRRGE